MADNQNTQSPELSKWAERMQMNRDFIAGQDAVKSRARAIHYMPLPAAGMTDADYTSYLKRVAFFPAASRVHDGCVSLIFRKDPILESPTLQAVKDIITQNGDSLETFSEEVVSEVLTTDYFAILVDHPADMPSGLNAANAIALNWRPFLAGYPYESILDFKQGLVNGLKGYTYVKLRDTAHQYRELKLINGTYTVTIHREGEGGEYAQASSHTPRRLGKPLDFIPFEIIKRHNGPLPKKALLEDVVNINASHYIQEGDLSQALYNCSGPQKVVINAARQKNPDGTDKERNEYPAGSHVVWELSGENVNVDFLEFTGAGVLSIREQQKELKSQMSAVGSRILADEKAVAEAAETLEIRRTSENATLAGVTRTIMRKMEKVLRWMAWWMGAESKEDPETRFTLNLDFTPAKTTPLELAAYTAAIQAGIMTKEQVFYLIRDGGLLADTITFDAYSSGLAAERIDEPTALPTSREL